MTSQRLTELLREEARNLGFDHVGVCPAQESPRFDRLRRWIEAGYAGQMHYLADRLDAYGHPSHVLEGARSLLVLATDYRNVEPDAHESARGRIARYAWGLDYHEVIRRRLNTLAEYHRNLVPDAQVRGVVDTAPLMEREFAVLAGLGWIGKNTLLLTRDHGSWLFLSVLLTSAELECDIPFTADHCGTCRACIDACPTDAFVGPYVLDARRCISYLTIELREMPPTDLREGWGNWLFGCDICQDVCPWNRRRDREPADSESNREFLPIDGETSVDLISLFALEDDCFRSRFRKTPLWRAKRRGLLRSAAILLGNLQPAGATDALILGLNDSESLVREASAWALGRVGGAEALRQRLEVERDKAVRREIRAALGM